jgi:hypothetical protein
MVALMAAWVPTTSLADGDPASDVLLQQPLFLPWDAGVSTAQQGQLTALLQAAAHSGYQLRVALIASPSDLGSVTELWRDPQGYAQFLGEELSLVYHGTLLVVMANGFGLYRSSGSTVAEHASLASVGTTGSGARLASDAIAAIQRLATASGHSLTSVRPLPTSNTSASGGKAPSSNTLPWIVFALGCVLIASSWTGSLRARPLRMRGQQDRLAG